MGFEVDPGRALKELSVGIKHPPCKQRQEGIVEQGSFFGQPDQPL